MNAQEGVTTLSVDILVNTVTCESEITVSNVLSVCVSLMQLVERYPKLKGSEKKDLVIRAIQLLIEKKGGDMSIMGMVPFFIDKAIAISNGELSIDVKSSCSDMLCCISKK